MPGWGLGSSSPFSGQRLSQALWLLRLRWKAESWRRSECAVQRRGASPLLPFVRPSSRPMHRESGKALRGGSVRGVFGFPFIYLFIYFFSPGLLVTCMI